MLNDVRLNPTPATSMRQSAKPVIMVFPRFRDNDSTPIGESQSEGIFAGFSQIRSDFRFRKEAILEE
jgi:hypothetical protein